MASMNVGELKYVLKLDDTEYKRGLKRLDDANSRMQRATSDSFKKAAGGVDDLTKQLDKPVDGLKKVAAQADRSMGEVATAMGKPAKAVDDFTSKAKRGMDSVSDHATKTSGLFSSSWGKAIAGAGVAMGGLLLAKGAATAVDEIKKSIDAASSLQEATSATEAVFKGSSDAMKQWAKTGTESLLLSQGDALKAAKTFGVLLGGSGVGEAENAKMSQSLVQLAADLASFNDTSVEEAIDGLTQGLRGETEGPRRFGIMMSDAAMKAEALASGLITAEVSMVDVQKAQARLMGATERNNKIQRDAGATEAEKAKALAEVAAAEEAVSKALNGKVGELTEAQKVQARYNMMVKQAELTNQAGDVARTADSYSNQKKQFEAQLKNLRETSGQAFLPVASMILKELNGLMPEITAWVDANKEKLSGVFTDAFNGLKENWPEIKDALLTFLDTMERIGSVTKMLWDVFQTLPPGLQSLIALAGVAKVSGLTSLVAGGASLARMAGVGGAAGGAGALGKVGGAKGLGVAAIGLGAVNNLRHTDATYGRADAMGVSRGGSQLVSIFDGATAGIFGLNQQLDTVNTELQKSRENFQAVQAEAQHLRELGHNIPVTFETSQAEQKMSWFDEWRAGVGTIASKLGIDLSGAWGAITSFFSGVATGWTNLVVGMAGTFTGWIGSAINSVKGFFANLNPFASNKPEQTSILAPWRSALGYANGGLLRGPGSGTSDSIPLWGSTGEYMLNKSTVDRIGVNTLDALNFGKAPGFATGGVIGSSTNGGVGVAGLSIGSVTVVAQDTSKFEREMRAKARTATLSGRRPR